MNEEELVKAIVERIFNDKETSISDEKICETFCELYKKDELEDEEMYLLDIIYEKIKEKMDDEEMEQNERGLITAMYFYYLGKLIQKHK